MSYKGTRQKSRINAAGTKDYPNSRSKNSIGFDDAIRKKINRYRKKLGGLSFSGTVHHICERFFNEGMDR